MPRISTELVRTLPREAKDIPDDEVRGFLIRCRPSGVHSYIARLGRGRVHTIGKVGAPGLTPTKARAEARAVLGQWEDEKRDARRAGRRADNTQVVPKKEKTTPTLDGYVTETYEPWVTVHRKSGAETVTRLRAAFPDLLRRRLDTLTGFDIERWRTERRKGTAKATTINRDLDCLRSCLSHAVKVSRVLKAHPMADVKKLKVDQRPTVRYLLPDEDTRLHAALKARDDERTAERDSANAWRAERGYQLYPPFGTYTDHLHPLVLLALHTGLRRGELFGLEWRDVDLLERLVTVRGEGAKSGHTRHVDLNATAVKALQRWQTDRAAVLTADAIGSALVFPSTSGQRLDNVQSAWESVLKAAAITGFRFHDLRHTFASRLVQAGVDLNTVRELLGHADLKMTLRYAHLSPEKRRAAVDRLVAQS